jgi:putative Holliday junction resolvase
MREAAPVPIMAIDLGSRRIGIAVSESGLIATPHSVIPNNGDVVERLTQLGLEVGVEMFIVGLPRRAHASEAEERYRRFAESLRQRTCKPVVLWDETLTTVEAEARLREIGRTRKQSKDGIDMHAAAVILQSWIDEQRRLP